MDTSVRPVDAERRPTPHEPLWSRPPPREQSRSGDGEDAIGGGEKGNPVGRSRQVARSPSIELIEETPRGISKPTQGNGRPVPGPSTTSRIIPSNEATSRIVPSNDSLAAGPSSHPSPARPLHTVPHRTLPPKYRLSDARQPVIFDLSSKSRPVRQVVETGAGILESGYAPLSGVESRMGKKSGDRRDEGRREMGLVGRNGVRAFPSREASDGREVEGRERMDGPSRNGHPQQGKWTSPVQTKVPRHHHRGDATDFATDERPVRVKPIRRRDESDFSDERPMRPKVRRRRDASDDSADDRPARRKTPHRAVHEPRNVLPDVSRRVRLREDRDSVSPPARNTQKDSHRRVDSTRSASPPLSRRVLAESSTTTTTRLPRPKPKPRRPDPARDESMAESMEEKSVQRLPRPKAKPRRLEARREASPLAQARRKEVQVDTDRRRPRVERMPSSESDPEYDEPDYDEPPPPPILAPQARPTAPSRDRLPPKKDFGAFLKRVHAKKGGAVVAPPSRHVEGPIPGLNRWRKIAMAAEREEQEDETEGSEEDELESEDGYQLGMEAEETSLPLLREPLPVRLNDGDGGFDEQEESEDEPPTHNPPRQRAESRKPLRRPRSKAVAGKVPAGRAEVRNAAASPSPPRPLGERRSSMPSRPASQRLPPPPISSPRQDFSPSLETTPPPPVKSRRQVYGPPSMKALRLAEKQAEMKKLIDAHDTLVREMFHLFNFKTMVVGYDPAEAKKETSKVWSDYKAQYDLVNKYITSNPYAEYQAAEDAGLSRRTTRRKIEQQLNQLPLEVLLGIPPELRIIKEESDHEMGKEVHMGIGGRRISKGKEVVRDFGSRAPSRSVTAPPNRPRSAPIALETMPPTPVEATSTTASEEPLPPMPEETFLRMDLGPRQISPAYEPSPQPVTQSPSPSIAAQDPFPPLSGPRLVRASSRPLKEERSTKKQRTEVPAGGEDEMMLDMEFFQDLHGMNADRLAEMARETLHAPVVPQQAETARPVAIPSPVTPPHSSTAPRPAEIQPSAEAPPRPETPGLMESPLVESVHLARTPFQEGDIPLPETVSVDAPLVASETTSRSSPQPVSVATSLPLVNDSPPQTPPRPRYTCPEQFPAHRPPVVPAAHVIFASPITTAFPRGCDVPSVFPAGILASVMLEADGEELSKEDLERMARDRVELMRKVAALQELGRTRASQVPAQDKAAGPCPAQSQTRHALLLKDVLRFRAHVFREDKQKAIQLKRITKAIQGYFSGSTKVLAPPHANMERKRRALGREVAKMVRLKWKEAAQYVRLRKEAAAKAEQERIGRENMNKILERSEKMLRNRARRKRIKENPRRETSEEPMSSRPDHLSRQISAALEDRAANVADRVNDAENEATAELCVKEEEATKVHERSSWSIQFPTSGNCRSPSQESWDWNRAFVDIPILSDAEKKSYRSAWEVTAVQVDHTLLLMSEHTPVNSDQPDCLIATQVPSEISGDALPAQTVQTLSVSLVDPPPETNQQAIESTFEITAEEEEQDRRFDEEMLLQHKQMVDSDDEDAGLLEDAELPIEELLARYNYKLDDISVSENTHHGSGAFNSETHSSADSDDEEDRLNIDESVAAPSESSSKSESDQDTNADTDAEQPVALPCLLRANLRPYQRTGLSWLARLYREKTNAILADEMGLGKTLQTIALLAHLACDQQEWGPHLIIVPTSVILNWEMEFKKFLPGFKVLAYFGSQQERKERRKGWFAPDAFQVCITSYQIAIADQAIFRRRHWQYLVLDEAHNIKNFRSQRWQTLLGFKSERRLLLTGTPLQNNLMELWSLMYFLMPAGLSAAYEGKEFADHREFSDWFSNPMEKAVESGDGISAEARETVNRLHLILRPFILRRLKAEVEKQLPAKVEHTVYCNLSKRQQYLYDEFMSRSSTRHNLVNGGYLGIANCLMQLRKVCNHPDLFEVRPIATSFAMQKSVVSAFRDAFIACKIARPVPLDTLQLNEFEFEHHGSGSSTRMEASARARLDATTKLLQGEITVKRKIPVKDTRTMEGWKVYQAYQKGLAVRTRWQRIRDINRQRCSIRPIICHDMLRAVRIVSGQSAPGNETPGIVLSPAQRLARTWPLLRQFAVIPPKATAFEPTMVLSEELQLRVRAHDFQAATDILHPAAVKLQIAFPDKTLLQYDCGKLQTLAEMLKTLRAGGHRVLIFTQMTKMLDILETFLSHAGYRYSRLDGSTKVEDRLLITERFNNNPRIFAFIASTRSGGVGINLTGADTVIFYDNEFNPAMDKQAMDRAHRIGQTREVHIYRLVTRHTVEENMLKKANQKRLLDDVVMQAGDFTTDYLAGKKLRSRNDLREMLGEDVDQSRAQDGPQPDLENPDPRSRADSVVTVDEREIQIAFEQAQDTEDMEAGREAAKELELEDSDFATDFAQNDSHGQVDPGVQPQGEAAAGLQMDDCGAVEEYMVRYVEEEWSFFS